MKDPIAIARARSLPRLRRALLRGWPRIAVGAMLALTTLAGFLCSVTLLHLGVGGMGLRYALSVLAAAATPCTGASSSPAVAIRCRAASTR